MDHVKMRYQIVDALQLKVRFGCTEDFTDIYSSPAKVIVFIS